MRVDYLTISSYSWRDLDIALPVLKYILYLSVCMFERYWHDLSHISIISWRLLIITSSKPGLNLSRQQRISRIDILNMLSECKGGKPIQNTSCRLKWFGIRQGAIIGMHVKVGENKCLLS